MRRALPVTALATAVLVPATSHAAGGASCAGPTVISALPYSDSGTTVGQVNDVAGLPISCNGFYTTANGPDVVYQLTLGTPPNNLTISVDPTGANWDPSIYLLTACSNGGTCAAGRGKDQYGSNGTETLSLTNLPAGTYFFYVDSFYASGNSLSAGSYDLSITGSLGLPPTAPVATPGSLTTAEDTPGKVTLPATDANGGDVLTFSIVTPPPTAEGTVSLNGAEATFTPAPNWYGTSSFTFRATDSTNLASTVETVTVTVTPVNDAPVANALSGSTAEDTPLDIALSGSDADPGDTLTFSIASQPPSGEGSLTLLGDVATFTPAANYCSQTSFTYQVTDAAGAASSAATVTIDVSPVNDAPVANAQTRATNEDTSIDFALTAFDPDSGDTLTFELVDTPPLSEGVVLLVGDVATFTPAPNYCAQTSFTFQVTDAANAVSAPATVTIDVAPVNDPPIAIGQTAKTDEDQPLVLTLAATDPDVGDPLELELVAPIPAAEGKVVIAGNQATFTPAANWSGDTSFSFFARDAAGAVSSAALVSISVEAVNDAPIAADIGTTTDEDTPVSVVLSATDVEGNGPLTFEITAAPDPAEGSVSLAGDLATFTPAANFHGQTSFKFRALDASLAASSEATATIVVGSVDDPPTFDDPTPLDDATLSVVAGDTLTFTMHASDPDSMPTYDVFDRPAASSFDAATGAFSWATTLADVGSTVVELRASDATSLVTRKLTLQVKTPAPDAGADAATDADASDADTDADIDAQADAADDAALDGAGGAGGSGGAGGGGGTRPDAGDDAAAPAAEGADEGDVSGSGCGCATVGTQGGTDAPRAGLLAALLAAIGLRRRRDRRVNRA